MEALIPSMNIRSQAAGLLIGEIKVPAQPPRILVQIAIIGAIRCLAVMTLLATMVSLWHHY